MYCSIVLIGTLMLPLPLVSLFKLKRSKWDPHYCKYTDNSNSCVFYLSILAAVFICLTNNIYLFKITCLLV